MTSGTPHRRAGSLRSRSSTARENAVAIAFSAFLDRAAPPDAASLAAAVPAASRALWDGLADWLAATYGLAGEPFFFGKQTGWVLRYRRSGTALVMLQPCEGGLRALLVVGPSLGAAVLAAPILPSTRAAYEAAHPYPEGRWFWLDVTGTNVVEDIERIVALKSPPPRRPRAAR